MAREGILTAIQAALAGLGGGIEGAQQYREMERRQRMQQDALNYQRQRDLVTDAREKARDAASIRSEERSALAAGMIPQSQYEQVSRFDMPGATPRPVALRQRIGEQDFVYAPSIAATEKHRGELATARQARVKQAETRSTVAEALAQVESGGKRLSQQQINTWSKLDRQERTSLVNNWIKANEPKAAKGGAVGAKGMPSAEELARAEGVWNSLTNVPDEQLSPEEVQFRNTMVRTFDKLRISQKKAPAPNLIFQAVAAADAQNKRIAAPPKSEDSGKSEREKRMEEMRRRREAQAGGTAPAAPKPAAAPTARSLEQQFPSQAAKIQEARDAGYTDEQIRQFLSRGR